MTSNGKGSRKAGRGRVQTVQPAFFQRLGVVPYLTKEAVSLTLKFISGIAKAVVIFAYAEPFQIIPLNAAVMSWPLQTSVGGGASPGSIFRACGVAPTGRSEGFNSVGRVGLRSRAPVG